MRSNLVLADLSTTVIAAFEGILFFNIFASAFSPLSPTPEEHAIALANGSTTIVPATAPESSNGHTALDALVQFGFELVPDNLMQLFLQSQLLGLITVAAFIGTSLGASTKGRLVVDLAQALNETFVAMIKRVILATPLGVSSLVAGSIAEAQDVGLVFRAL